MHSDQRATNMILVAQPPGHKRHDGSEDIRRRAEELALGGGEAHAVLEDDGQEVRVRVTRQGRGHEVERPDIETPILQVVQDPREVDLVLLGVAAVKVDPVDDKGLLLGSQEVLGRGFGREVDDDEPAQDAHGECDDAFDYEDP